ncbi:ATP-binding cassette domain-containing protein [Aeromicrobium sp. SMF47]|uniref:ATP-binding cassette domain-containing protein n=1 Tax=Aeromicrobium yanjiei TaxID=2662028 RepID=A0A5Q2MGI7_9ACTN|nr:MULTISPECIES: ABC transporter ATP-binding protein [Aeromicrobium]MRJ76578.1 ATP-binding cassette domain-containing protein [Aeromicrobium yanjiei]MRK00921.1 ATP-binding cassette domain-containing protein [Aeromicrobium sp. S22]QGG42267.1 ATP-binding cassette domain-containing protein [Aeromicrobium yanjiei]
MSSIEVRHLTTAGRAGSRPLLDDISLHVPDGTTLAIAGPRGGGKSLLLRTLAGLEDHTSGDVLVGDTVVNTVGPRGRDLAMVFQDHALHPHLDVFDNLAFSSLLRRGFDKDELSDRIHEVADFLALGDLLELKPADLDDAQAQRVALGRSLVRDAQAYLFDSPFSAQSERVRTHVRSVTTQWQQERGRTSIFTTSSVEEALSTADRVAVMHQGFIHQVGTPRELYERPADMFVAGYLGSPPMNLVPAFPMGRELVMPLATMALDDALLERIGDRGVVVAGIRPEHCHDATGPGGQAVTERVELTARIDDVEWRGRSQFAYLGYEIAPEVEDLLEEVEDLLEFDLFQSFLVAELAADSTLEPGMSISVVIPRHRVHVFDPETGENLTL